MEEAMNTLPCGREQGTMSVLQSVFSLGNAGSPAFYFRTSSFFFLSLVWERGFVRSLTPPFLLPPLFLPAAKPTGPRKVGVVLELGQLVCFTT